MNSSYTVYYTADIEPTATTTIPLALFEAASWLGTPETGGGGHAEVGRASTKHAEDTVLNRLYGAMQRFRACALKEVCFQCLHSVYGHQKVTINRVKL